MIRSRRSFLMSAAAVIALGWVAHPGAVRAEAVIFPVSSYDVQASATALDLVNRTPGFALVEPDDDVRGYGGAQGNLLIDGARPTSKRESLSDLLKRIPAGSVERIELVQPGTAGVDMAGFPVLLNVIRRRDVAAEGAVEVGGVASTDGWGAALLRAEYARRRGDRTLELALSHEPELDDDSGKGRIAESADGVTDISAWDTRTVVDTSEGSAMWNQPLAGGRLALNGAGRREATRTDSRFDALTPGGETQIVDEQEDLTEAEAAARFERDLGGARVNGLLSQRMGWIDASDQSLEDDEQERFAEQTHTGETIARAEVSRDWGPRLTASGSLEGAFNFLESQTRLTEDGVEVAVPGSDVRIEERRAEGAVQLAYRPGETISLEAGLRVETSEIAQSGDSDRTRRFTYAKPRIAARWDVGPTDQLRLSLSREVGQLDFGDFVASASLERGTVSAGAVDLRPDTTWRAVAAWERRFWDDGSLTLTWTHDRIEDAIDRVLVIDGDDQFDAPGNIGDGRRDTLGVELQAPLARVGIGGGRLRASLLWTWSEVTDPTTGEARRISEEKPFEGQVEFTQDLPSLDLRWGLTIDHISERKEEYRFDEVRREAEALGFTVFVEREIRDVWRLRLEATDLFGRDFEETRTSYDGPRSVAAPASRETRRRETPGFASLSLRRSF